MKLGKTAVVALWLTVAMLGVAAAQEQPAEQPERHPMEQPMKVADLGTEINNVVTVEGHVAQYQEDAATTSVYHLRDDWGGVVMIRTAKPLPEVAERLMVTGTVTVDPLLNVPSIVEDTREVVRRMPPPPPDSDGDGVPDEADACPDKPGPIDRGGCPRSNTLLYVLIGATVVVLIAFVLVLVRIARSSKRGGVPEAPPLPPPAETVGGDTIKIHSPPPGTLKLLPGHFEVAAGEPSLKEIRLFKTSGSPEIETTIGRLPGEPYKHIQLNLQTVSRKQAKLVFADGHYRLINYAPQTSNPTRVNGIEMGVNESRQLQDGDRIAMGEVELVYHAS